MDIYEKKYKEALERARDIVENQNASSVWKDWLCNTFLELKESEDEKAREEIKQLIQCMHDADPRKERWIAWLEKQGEQKASYTTIAETGNGGINALVTREVSTNDYEEKPVGKVEPKFHEGEWIVQENIGTYKVIEVCESWYEVIDVEDNHYSIAFDKEYMCHLWTIQDAKPGDVLVYNNSSVEIILLFKKWMNGVGDGAYSYAHTFNNEILFNDWSDCGYTAHPATKEQRDTLMKAIANAGYEWNEEKKELKLLITNGGDFESENCEQKPAWSEEDEVKINRIVDCLENLNVADNDILLKDVDWLNSLRPQNRWKPTKQQLSELRCVISGCSFETSVLVELEKNLKKLL